MASVISKLLKYFTFWLKWRN